MEKNYFDMSAGVSIMFTMFVSFVTLVTDISQYLGVPLFKGFQIYGEVVTTVSYYFGMALPVVVLLGVINALYFVLTQYRFLHEQPVLQVLFGLVTPMTVLAYVTIAWDGLVHSGVLISVFSGNRNSMGMIILVAIVLAVINAASIYVGSEKCEPKKV